MTPDTDAEGALRPRASSARAGSSRRRESRSSTPPGSRPASAPARPHCGLKDGGKTDVGLIVCDAAEVSSAMLLTRNASAAAPVRVCRDRSSAARCARRSSTPATPTPRPASRGSPTRWRCASGRRAELGLDARAGRRRRDRDDRRAAADRRGPRAGSARRRPALSETGGDELRGGDHDHRPLARSAARCAPPTGSPSRPRPRAPG